LFNASSSVPFTSKAVMEVVSFRAARVLSYINFCCTVW